MAFKPGGRGLVRWRDLLAPGFVYLPGCFYTSKSFNTVILERGFESKMSRPEKQASKIAGENKTL